MLLRPNFWMPTIFRDGEGGGGAGGEGGDGGKGGAGAGDFIATLPETIRSHAALKEVKDGAGFTAILDRHLSFSKPLAEQLPKDIAGEAAFKDIKTWDDLSRSYLSAQKMIGIPKDQILRVPADDKPESWKPVYDRLGRPEKPDGYKLTPNPAIKLDENLQKGFLETAHESGLSQKQAEKLYGWYNEQVAKAVETNTAAVTKGIEDAGAALKTEWGAAYEQKLGLSIKAMEALDKTVLGGKGELQAALDATKLGNHPAFAKLFAQLGAQMAEDGIIGRADGADALASPMEARQQIAAKQNDTAFMKRYLDKNAAGHREAVEEMEALYKQAAPQAQAA